MLVSLSAPLLLELRKCRSHEGPFRRPRVGERSHAPSSNQNLRCTVNSDAKCSVPGQAPTTPHVLPSFPTTSDTLVGFTREKNDDHPTWWQHVAPSAIFVFNFELILVAARTDVNTTMPASQLG